jgi:mono/diheme cytochrome c family protein
MKLSAALAASLLVGACARPDVPPASTARATNDGGFADARRGELLYDGACLACHTEKKHWRDQQHVNTWPQLVYQVDRWQRIAGQNWGPAEVDDTASYLNQRFYRVPCPIAGCGGGSG